MNLIRTIRFGILSALVAVGTVGGSDQQVRAQRIATASQSGTEVLTRGPVHEAFAEMIAFDPEPGPAVDKAPPEPINEIVPNERPAGDNVTWIPGYWAWDDERSDFLWVSGIWRVLPPGRQWVPGYWGQSQLGAQWTSGYWADAAASETEYLPEPPASVETGPNIAQPAEDAIWLPGCWVWQQNRYGWRAGYWTRGNQDWDWVPDHYVWTPSGYVFVDGYYDYAVARRGTVYAPVYFNQRSRSQTGFSYSPSAVINSGVFLNHLFLRPSYGHYYFGDYYGSEYAATGYSPWFSFQSGHRGYDPIYANQRWQHRGDKGWEQNKAANFQNLRNNAVSRPPHNWEAQSALTSQQKESSRSNFVVTSPLDELTKGKVGQTRFQPVNPAERQQFGQRGQQYRQYLQNRRQMESSATMTTGAVPTTATASERRKLSKSPFVAEPADQLGPSYAPPERHQVLKPDFQIQPQPRRNREANGARPGFAPTTTNSPAGHTQDVPRGQSQQQGANRVNRPNGTADQSQIPTAASGGSRQGSSHGQPQGGTNHQPQSTSTSQPQNGTPGLPPAGASSGGQQQSGTGGAPASGGQATAPTPAAPPSEN